jgi:hypothetical protein
MRIWGWLLLLAAAVAGAENVAYLYGMAGVVAGDYATDDALYQKMVGSYAYNPPPPPTPYAVDETSTDLAISPFAFGMKGTAWRMNFELLWNRHRVSADDDRQVNTGALYGGAGYVLSRGFFADNRVKPYFGGFFLGRFTKAGNMHNGVVAAGFGPDLGAVVNFDLNHSYLLFTVGYQYKNYLITGTKFDAPEGDDPPTGPHYNYTYIPAADFPTSAGSYFVSLRSTLQLHRRVGAEVEVRFEDDVNHSFTNGLTFAVGPSVWL